MWNFKIYKTETETDNADDEITDKEMVEASECRKVTCTILLNQGALAQMNIHPSTSVRNASFRDESNRIQPKLPKLESNNFSGKIHEWQEFRDGLSSKIHENEDLSKVDKLTCLKAFLKDSAKALSREFRPLVRPTISQ